MKFIWVSPKLALVVVSTGFLTQPIVHFTLRARIRKFKILNRSIVAGSGIVLITNSTLDLPWFMRDVNDERSRCSSVMALTLLFCFVTPTKPRKTARRFALASIVHLSWRLYLEYWMRSETNAAMQVFLIKRERKCVEKSFDFLVCQSFEK